MRKLFSLALLLFGVLALRTIAQSDKTPYKIEFDKTKDVEQMDRSPDGKEQKIFIKVRFAVLPQDPGNLNSGSAEYKIVIEESNKKVKEVDVPSQALLRDMSVVFAIDTSNSMKGYGRMTQVR